MHALRISAAAACGLLAVACAHGGTNAERAVVPVAADVKITVDEAGAYSFAYNGPFFDEKGNFDFSQKGAVTNTIKLTFTIADGSVPGITFKPVAEDAMWIVEKKHVDEATGSPRGPYRGGQFEGFEVSGDRQQFMVVDNNNDGVLYRYGLRFDLDGETVIDDPDGQNGGHN